MVFWAENFHSKLGTSWRIYLPIFIFLRGLQYIRIKGSHAQNEIDFTWFSSSIKLRYIPKRDIRPWYIHFWTGNCQLHSALTLMKARFLALYQSSPSLLRRIELDFPSGSPFSFFSFLKHKNSNPQCHPVHIYVYVSAPIKLLLFVESLMIRLDFALRKSPLTHLDIIEI